MEADISHEHIHEHSAACQELLAELGAYLDGDAAAAACAAIERHLEGCPDCRALVATMRKSVQLAHDLPQPVLTPEAKKRLLAVLHL
jgi:anti-sigma factor RsiW